MPTFVAFLRAVNVGKRWVKMEELRNVLGDNDFRDVATHIQSGNVRVSTPLRSVAKVEARLRSVISEAFGFDVPVVVRTPTQLRQIAEAADALESPLSERARRYVTFTTGTLSPTGVAALEEWAVPGEAARVIGQDVVLFLDTSSHAAKLTNVRLERLLGVTGTARDIKVVRTLAARWGA